MIKQIFIPEKIGSFYIFTERTVGIEISKTEILAALVSAHGTRRKIELLVKEPISQDQTIALHERIHAALAAVFAKLGSYTQLIITIPSDYLIFKEISVPLMGAHKMKMILPFEVESQLPFPLDQASIDAIVVSRDSAARKASLCIAAIKRDTLTNLLAPYSTLGVTADRVTTDLFEIYGLYHTIPEYHHNQEPTLLLMIDETTTQLLLLINNQIKGIRVMQRGLASLHQESASIHLDDHVTMRALDGLFDEIKLTIENFFTKLHRIQQIARVIICGKTTEIKGFQEYVARVLQVPCELLTLNRVLHNNTVTTNLPLSNEFFVPLAAALLSPVTEDVDLNRQAAEAKSNSIIEKQLVSAGILTSLLFIMLLANAIITQRSLRNELAASEAEAVTTLSKKLNLSLPKGKRTLDQVNVLARQEIERKENIWFALSSGSRFSFLTYLQDLSTRIHRDALGLDLRQLTINKDTSQMTLEGQVKNFDALRTLEEDLSQSKNFRSVSTPQDLKFTIDIVLKKPGETEQ